MNVPPTHTRVCELCRSPAEISVTRFDGIAPEGPPRYACRYCLGRPGRADPLVRRADVVRLQDLVSGQSSTGRATELPALLGALTQQTAYRTITGAIRVQSLAAPPLALVCAACGGLVSAREGGVLSWLLGADGVRREARVFHGATCAADAGRPLSPGGWEDLDHLASLAGGPFDAEALGFITDVEVAWRRLRDR